MIQISGGVSDYPFVSLNLKVIGLFEKACLNHSKSELTNLATLLRSLECYLQITDQTLNISTIKSSKFLDLSIGFVGALNDPLLFDFSQTRKYTLTRLFLALANKLETLLRAPKFPIFTISLTSNSEDVINCITRFQKFILNEEKLWLWKGWPCLNRRGRLYWAPLYPVYERLGREFTDQLYLHCKEYFEARFCGTIPCLKQLSGFIGKYAEPLKPEYFSRPGFVTRFFRLEDISNKPDEYLLNHELINSLKSQGALAKLMDTDRGIVASSINTQKRIAESIFIRGYEELNRLRVAASEAIEKKILENNRSGKETRAALKDLITQLKHDHQSLREDLLLLTMALEKAFSQGTRYAEHANPAIQALCKKEQRELLDALTLRKHVLNTNVVKLSEG